MTSIQQMVIIIISLDWSDPWSLPSDQCPFLSFLAYISSYGIDIQKNSAKTQWYTGLQSLFAVTLVHLFSPYVS
jgi:hypothetical protein